MPLSARAHSYRVQLVTTDYFIAKLRTTFMLKRAVDWASIVKHGRAWAEWAGTIGTYDRVTGLSSSWRYMVLGRSYVLETRHAPRGRVSGITSAR